MTLQIGIWEQCEHPFFTHFSYTWERRQMEQLWCRIWEHLSQQIELAPVYEIHAFFISFFLSYIFKSSVLTKWRSVINTVTPSQRQKSHFQEVFPKMLFFFFLQGSEYKKSGQWCMWSRPLNQWQERQVHPLRKKISWKTLFRTSGAKYVSHCCP